jgi:hypothetical protein
MLQEARTFPSRAFSQGEDKKKGKINFGGEELRLCEAMIIVQIRKR